MFAGSRRRFLSDVGRGMIVASVGSSGQLAAATGGRSFGADHQQ